MRPMTLEMGREERCVEEQDRMTTTVETTLVIYQGTKMTEDVSFVKEGQSLNTFRLTDSVRVIEKSFLVVGK